MRKKTVKNMCSTIFWYLLYFLPIILTLVQSIGLFERFTLADYESIANNYSYSEFQFANLLRENLRYSFGVDYTNIIYNTLYDIFGDGGILSIFADVTDGAVIPLYMTYFIGVYLMHLLVDFILFIPKLCHKWLNYFTRSEDCE